MSSDNPDKTISNQAFVINMINACVGIGLLVKPYALTISEYYCVISVLMAFCFIYLAGYLFAKVAISANNISLNGHAQYEPVETIDSDDIISDNVDINMNQNQPVDVQSNKTDSIYQTMGYKAAGNIGKYYVSFAMMVIFFMILVNCLIIEWDLLSRIIQLLYQNSSITVPVFFESQFLFFYVFLYTLPLIFVRNWKQLTFISYISVLSISGVVIAMIYVYCLYRYNNNMPELNLVDEQNTAKNAVDKMTLIERIFFSFLIFKAGIAGTSAIPKLIVNMKDKSWNNIRFVIFISYIVVIIISVSFGVLGSIVYGLNVDILILNNMLIWPGGFIVIIVSVVKIINIWSSFGIYLSLCSDLMGNTFLQIQKHQKNTEYLLRFIILLFTLFIGYLGRHHLAFVTSILSASGSLFGTTLMLPLILYIAMFYKSMTWFSKLVYIFLVFFAIFVAVMVVVSTSKSMV
eukprot:246002_1